MRRTANLQHALNRLPDVPQLLAVLIRFGDGPIWCEYIKCDLSRVDVYIDSDVALHHLGHVSPPRSLHLNLLPTQGVCQGYSRNASRGPPCL